MILTLAAKPGDHFTAEFDAEEDAIVFRRVARSDNWLEILKACPVKIVVNSAGRRHARPHPWVQGIRRPRVGRAATPVTVC